MADPPLGNSSAGNKLLIEPGVRGEIRWFSPLLSRKVYWIMYKTTSGILHFSVRLSEPAAIIVSTSCSERGADVEHAMVVRW